MSATHGHKLKFFRNCLHIHLQFLPHSSLSLIPEGWLGAISCSCKISPFFLHTSLSITKNHVLGEGFALCIQLVKQPVLFSRFLFGVNPCIVRTCFKHCGKKMFPFWIGVFVRPCWQFNTFWYSKPIKKKKIKEGKGKGNKQQTTQKPLLVF